MSSTDNVIQMNKDSCNNERMPNSHFLEMTINHDARLSVLEERFESHSDRWDAQFDKIIKELKEIKDVYYKERNDFITRIGSIESDLKAEMRVTKVYLTIAGGIAGVIATFLTSYFKQLI